MKGFIYLYQFGESGRHVSYFITIETNELIPIVTPVLDQKHATFTSRHFTVKKITRSNNTRELLEEARGYVYGSAAMGYVYGPEDDFHFHVGDEIKNTDKIHVFSTYQHLRSFCKRQQDKCIPNGWFMYYSFNGKLSYTELQKKYILIKRKYYSSREILSHNIRKNRTVLRANDGNIYSYPSIINFYRDTYDCYLHNQIAERQYYKASKMVCKTYSSYDNYDFSKQNYKASSGKQHGLCWLSVWVDIYKFGRLLPTKNLQIFRKSPWNPMGDINKISVF